MTAGEDVNFLWELFVVFCLIYFIAINAQYTLLLALSFFGSKQRNREADVADFESVSVSKLTPPVSIVIAAYNEEPVIVDSVLAALALNYPEYELIIVNDGSRDRTLRTMIETFELVRSDRPYRAVIPTAAVRRVYRSQTIENLLVIDKENGGKADSLNAGVNLARYRYICTTDADTVFEPDAMLRIMRPVLFDPQRLIALGGQVRVGNGFEVVDGKIVERRLPRTLLPTLQLVEYLRTFLGNRVGWSVLNSMLLISGAFGLWRRDVLVTVGGFSPHITGEDLELTFRLHRYMRKRGEDYKIISLPDPVCWTEVPVDIPSFTRQRNRWHRVLLESFSEHREMMLNHHFGVVGLLGMPYYFFFEIIGPFAEAISYVIVLSGWMAGAIPTNALVLFLFLSVGYTTLLNAMAILIEDFHYGTYSLTEVVKLIFVGFLDNLGYRQYTMFVRMWATFDWMGKVKSWGKIERRGFHAR